MVNITLTDDQLTKIIADATAKGIEIGRRIASEINTAPVKTKPAPMTGAERARLFRKRKREGNIQ